MIPEKLRSTIMNFFRMPINICAILTLFASSLLTTYQICFICAIVMTVASVVNIYLLNVHVPPDTEKRTLTKTSEFRQIWEISKARAQSIKLN